MRNIITLNGYPSNPDCVSWSDECVIAVGQSDRVTLLLPNYKADRTVLQSGDLWTPLNLPTNLFSIKEFPVDEPANNPIFSAGEEISESYVVDLKWSPPGLSSNYTCALGVLTSNLILSIWEPSRYPLSKASNWARCMTINSVLVRYFQDQQPKNTRDLNSIRSEQLRCFQRVRSFAWACALPIENDVQFIAVANDNAEIIIIQISVNEKVHLAAVKARINLSSQDVERAGLTKTFEEILSNRCYASHLAWSSWFNTEALSFSIIAFAWESHVVFRKVIWSTTSDTSLHVEDIATKLPFDEDMPISGLFEFSQHVENGQVTFFASIGNLIISCEIHVQTGEMKAQYSHSRVEWDQISGMSLVRPSRHNRLDVAPHISFTRDSVVSFAVPMLNSLGNQMPGWKEDLLSQAFIFNVENRLPSGTRSRIWGMDVSPLGDIVVTVATFHPKGIPDYPTSAKARTYLAVSSAGFQEEGYFLPVLDLKSSKLLNSEAIVLSLRQRVNQDAVDGPPTTESLIKELGVDKVIADQQELPDLSKSNIDSPDSAVKSLRSILHSYNVKRQQLTNLISIVLGDTANATRELTVVYHALYPLIIEIARLSTDSVETRHIVNAYSVAGQLQGTGPTTSNSSPNLEVCEICDASIPMRHIDIAKCDKGHQFVRCGLSLLAIQAPGISKSCGICGKKYLCDKLPPHRGSSPNDFNVELRQLLFSACVTCLYCGGKFAG